MRRFLIIGLILSLCAMVPAPTDAALIGDPEQRPNDFCFFLPTGEGLGNCTYADIQMYEIRQKLNQIIDSGYPWEMIEEGYTHYYRLGERVMRDNGPVYVPSGTQSTGDGSQRLHISLTNQYLVNDYKEVGANVRFASIKFSGGRPALMVIDALNRPMKLTHGQCESAGGWILHNIGFPLAGAWLGGKTVAGAPKHIQQLFKVTVQNSEKYAAALERIASSTLFITTIAADTPDIGDCELLVDVLNPPGWGGVQYHYRASAVLGDDGTITPRPWTNVFNMDTGQGYWKQFGPVSYDGDGNPIW